MLKEVIKVAKVFFVNRLEDRVQEWREGERERERESESEGGEQGR